MIFGEMLSCLFLTIEKQMKLLKYIKDKLHFSCQYTCFANGG